MSERIRTNDAPAAPLMRRIKGAIRRLRKIHREAAGAEVAPKLLAKKHFYIRFVVDDENKGTHMLSPALRGLWKSRYRAALFSIGGNERNLFYTHTAIKNVKCFTWLEH